MTYSYKFCSTKLLFEFAVKVLLVLQTYSLYYRAYTFLRAFRYVGGKSHTEIKFIAISLPLS